MFKNISKILYKYFVQVACILLALLALLSRYSEYLQYSSTRQVIQQLCVFGALCETMDHRLNLCLICVVLNVCNCIKCE